MDWDIFENVPRMETHILYTDQRYIFKDIWICVGVALETFEGRKFSSIISAAHGFFILKLRTLKIYQLAFGAVEYLG